MDYTPGLFDNESISNGVIPDLFDEPKKASSGVIPDLFSNTPKRDLNAEFHPMRELSRGGAGLRNMLQGRSFVEGAMNPESVPSFASFIPANPESNTPELDTWFKAGLGTVADLGIDPINALPMPIGKAIGGVVSKFAEAGIPLFKGIADWTTRNLPNLAPNVLKRSVAVEQQARNIPTTGLEDILKKMQPQQDITPVTPPVDESAGYQAWLQQNAQPKGGSNPFFDVPQFDFTQGPSIPEFKNTGDAAAFGQANKDNPEIVQKLKDTYDQGASKLDEIRSKGENASDEEMSYAFSAGQKNQLYREAYEAATGTGGFKPAAPQPPDNLFGLPPVEPKAPVSEERNMIQQAVEDPNQKKLDFSKGVEQFGGGQIDKLVNDMARKPDSLRPAAFKGMSRADIAQTYLNQEIGKPVIKTELPSIFDTSQPKMKNLTNQGEPIHMADTYELSATEADRIRREQLLADRAAVDSAPEGGAYGSVDEGAISPDELPIPKGAPSTIEDIKTVIKNIRLKGSDPNIIEMNAGAKPPDFELTPEGEAALKRVIETAKASGKSMSQYVKENFPNLSDVEAQQVAQAAAKIGNLNLRQYPDEQKAQLQDLFKGHEDKLKTKPMTDQQITDKAKELTTLPVTENIIRSGEGQTAAEVRRRVMTDIAKLKAISEDPNLSAQEQVQQMLRLGTQQTKKVKTEIGRALGGMKTPLEAQEQQLAAIRKIVDRLRSDPNLKSAESQAVIAKLRSQFPDMEKNVTPAEIFKFMFRNFITSSPRTLAANATSGYGNIAARPLMRALEVTSAKIRSLISQNPTSATYKEIGAMYQGMFDALSKGQKLPESLRTKTFSDKYNVSPLATKAALAKTKLGKGSLEAANAAISLPENVMRKTDDHVKNALGMMEKYAAQARGEDVFADQHVIDRITSAQARGSFQDEMSAIGRWVAQSRNFFSKQEPTAFNQSMDVFTYAIQPFIQTVDRIIAKGWNTSILGTPTLAVKGATGQYRGAFAKGIMKDEVKGEKFDRDIAAAMIGVPLFVWAGSQLASGNITGAAPQDSAGREAFGNSGKTEYSIKVKGRWIPMRDLPEPMSTALQINIALIQGMSDAKDKGKDLMEGAFHVAQKLGYMLGTKQYLSGMNSLLGYVGSKSYDTVNEVPLTKKIVPSLIPSAVKDVGVIKDTLQGKPRVMADTAIEATKRRVGMTDGMVPELNTFGEEVTHPMMGQDRGDAAHTLAEKFPPQPVDRTREGVKLSQQEYYDLKKAVGEQRKRVFTSLAKNEFFMSAPKGVQKTIVAEMISQADEIGSTPQKIKELQKDPLYYDRSLRTLLEIDKPGGERHFPFLKKASSSQPN